MKKPVIVRSSSPFGYGDFEGIFKSIKEVYAKRDLKRAIQEIEESAISERTHKYANQNNFKINEEIHTIIQEQQTSEYIGGILRHPNDPDKIYIGFRTDEGMYKNDNFTLVFDESTGKFINKDVNEKNKKDIKTLIESYKEIETLQDISKDHSLFVEYSLNPFSIFQVRPFKKIETADFEIPSSNLKGEYLKDYLLTDVCFGITPPEGIVLPVLKSVGINEVMTIFPGTNLFEGKYFKIGSPDGTLPMDLENVLALYRMNAISEREFLINSRKIVEMHNNQMNKNFRGQPYCFVTSSIKNDSFDTDLSVPNSKAIIIGRCEDFLVHNPLRLIKKADYSIFYNGLIVTDFYKNISSLENKVKIISNGKKAVAMKN